MTFKAVANGARSIWPWTLLRLSSGGWSLPPSSDGDSSVLPGLLEQIPGNEEIGTVTADGAYDTRICHTAIIDRQTAQIQLRIALMNRFSVLGTAEIIRVARGRRRKGASGLWPELRHKAHQISNVLSSCSGLSESLPQRHSHYLRCQSGFMQAT